MASSTIMRYHCRLINFIAIIIFKLLGAQWGARRGRGRVWEEHGVGGAERGRGRVWEGHGVGGAWYGRSTVWEELNVGGAECGRNMVWEGFDVGGAECGKARTRRASQHKVFQELISWVNHKHVISAPSPTIFPWDPCQTLSQETLLY